MTYEQTATTNALPNNQERSRTDEEPIRCPICLHPIPYSKKFQCRRCGYMPG